MTPAYAQVKTSTPREQDTRATRQILLMAMVLGTGLLAGCNLPPSGGTLFAWKTTPPAATQKTVASAPATQTQPAAAAASEPADPALRLTQEVQQYVSNLPMDDLQAKLSHREGDAASASTLNTQEHAAATEPVIPPPPVASRSPEGSASTSPGGPLQPEIIVPAARPESAASLASRPAETSATPKDTRIVDIEISPAALASASPKSTGQQPNQPANVRTNNGSSAGDLKDLLDQLRKEATDRPDSVGAALRVRLAEWSLTGKTAGTADWPLQDAEKRRLAESVWQVLQAVSRTDGATVRTSSEEFEKALETLGETLRQVRPMKIPNAVLCWSVQSFGNYEALAEPWKFPAGATSMVVLYCELTGFSSEASTEKPGWYRTLLGERLAILTSDGKELWNYDEPSIEDLCRRPRRDFFVTKKLRIPGNLPAGPYVLKVTIRDQIANRVTETNVPFEIATAQ
jgi:hypothetical protein